MLILLHILLLILLFYYIIVGSGTYVILWALYKRCYTNSLLFIIINFVPERYLLVDYL